MKTLTQIVVIILSLNANAHAEWYKGNTHSHTVLNGHSDSTAEQVTNWYHERDYNFLVLSEHNRFIDPAQVTMPSPLRPDFILIPGVEISGPKHIHTTAFNVNNVIDWKFDSVEKYKIVQSHVDGTLEANGLPILNHPNFEWALNFNDINNVERLQFFELYNGHPGVHNRGDAIHDSTEVIWDKLLTSGKKIYALSSDDSHIFKVISADKTNPGRGWIMVNAPSLDAKSITGALKQGNFYASNGVMLKAIETKDERYTVEVDLEKSHEVVSRDEVIGHIRRGIPFENSSHCMIEFIGQNGKILNRIEKNKASFSFHGMTGYVRAKISYFVKKNNLIKAYYAWTQPIFLD
ncbi:MAG: CehA/McbA family metallohydrolase [Bdellovibrio sp.]|nr:CehA/McbA family metallohydrolase [Bdellovibrio sp.]